MSTEGCPHQSKWYSLIHWWFSSFYIYLQCISFLCPSTTKQNTHLQSYIECMLWHSHIAIQIIPNQTNESTMMYIKQQCQQQRNSTIWEVNLSCCLTLCKGFMNSKQAFPQNFTWVQSFRYKFSQAGGSIKKH